MGFRKITLSIFSGLGLLASRQAWAECVQGLTQQQILSSGNDAFCSVTPSALCGPPVPSLSWMGALLLVLAMLAAGATLLWKRRLLARTAMMLLSVVLLGAGLWLVATPPPTLAHVRQTSAGNPITHYHNPGDTIPRDLNGTEKACIDADNAMAWPGGTRDPAKGPTIHYNCHGYTFDNSMSWIDDSKIEQILIDDYVKVQGAKMVGDIAVYRDPSNNIIHTGKVTAAPGGTVTEVTGKWGMSGEYKHPPTGATNEPYGNSVNYYR